MATTLARPTTAAAKLYDAKLCTAEDAVAPIPSGSKLLVGMAVGQPPAVLSAVADRVRADDLTGLRLYYKIAMDPLADSLLQPDVISKIEAHTFFVAGPDHKIIKEQIADDEKLLVFHPVNFSMIPRVVQDLEPDTFVVTVSPMDNGGYFSLGTDNDFASVAARAAKRLIVEVNPRMPRVFGDSQIHVTEVDAIVEHEAQLVQVPDAPPSPADTAIGNLIAPLVPNGATLQLGIGKVSSAAAAALMDHRDLGIHTELFSGAFVPLIEAGVATGAKKNLHRHNHVWTVALGDDATYEFMNDNGAMESYASSYVNDPGVIRQNDRMTSINAAIEVDLYGQVNAEFIGGKQYSGSGGQFDFVKGAGLSEGGKSIIALHATARGGELSTIVPKVGMVTDNRMDVEYVVTENGVAYLRGKSTKERALALIDLADDRFKDDLLKAAKDEHLIA